MSNPPCSTSSGTSSLVFPETTRSRAVASTPAVNLRNSVHASSNLSRSDASESSSLLKSELEPELSPRCLDKSRPVRPSVSKAKETTGMYNGPLNKYPKGELSNKLRACGFTKTRICLSCFDSANLHLASVSIFGRSFTLRVGFVFSSGCCCWFVWLFWVGFLFVLVFAFHVFEIILVVLQERTTVRAVMARTAWEKNKCWFCFPLILSFHWSCASRRPCRLTLAHFFGHPSYDAPRQWIRSHGSRVRFIFPSP